MRPPITLVALAAGLLAACSSPPIALDAPAMPAVSAVAGAGAVRLDVVGQDKRSQFSDRVGTYRILTRGPVTAGNDVTDYVRSAVASSLTAEGFVPAAGGLVVIVELQNFYCDVGTFTTTAAVAFTLRARTLAGRTLYAHYYEASAIAGSGGSSGNCKAGLQQATAEAIRKVALDQDLTAALVSGGRQST